MRSNKNYARFSVLQTLYNFFQFCQEEKFPFHFLECLVFRNFFKSILLTPKCVHKKHKTIFSSFWAFDKFCVQYSQLLRQFWRRIKANRVLKVKIREIRAIFVKICRKKLRVAWELLEVVQRASCFKLNVAMGI